MSRTVSIAITIASYALTVMAVTVAAYYGWSVVAGLAAL